MPIQILMPALSPTMTEGSVARWLKKEGDEIHSGDVIAEIETDKATMEYEAVDEGRLGKIIVPEGTQGIKVNELIAILLAEGEDASAIADLAVLQSRGNGGAPTSAPHPSPLPAGGERESAVNVSPRPVYGERAAERSEAGEGQSPKSPAPQVREDEDQDRIFASPLARRMAAQAGLDLATHQGLGAAGSHRQG